MGASLTRLQLERVTDFLAFERLCNAVMVRYFRHIEPLGGYKDKGRDALHYSNRRGIHTIFQYSVRKDWETKLKEDLEKIRRHQHPCQQVVFVSNQEIGAGDRDRVIQMVAEQYGWQLRLCSLEQLATMIDDRGDELKGLYPEIFFVRAQGERPFRPLDIPAYLAQVVRDHRIWEERYTPLFVDRFEFDLQYADRRGDPLAGAVSATSIPTLARRSVLLGESGAGKTATLWRLALATAQTQPSDGPSLLPVLVPLRNWSEEQGVLDLVVSQFTEQQGHPAAIEALLLRGDVLLLLDGVNELPALPQVREAAGRDLRGFLMKFPRTTVVMTCRTADYIQDFVDPGLGFPPTAYEAQRLTESQIRDYVRRTLDAQKADHFLRELGISDTLKWSDSSAILHLARIPFYLRLLLSDFETTGHLPASSAQLVQRLLRRISQPRPGQRAPTVDAYRKEQVLAEVAGASLQVGGGLVLPTRLARGAVDAATARLHAEHRLAIGTTADDLWADLHSENLLQQVRHSENGTASRLPEQVEWLHQLFRDYFLAVFILSLSHDAEQRQLGPMRVMLRVVPEDFVSACVIALALAPTLERKRFLFDEFRQFADLSNALMKELPEAEVQAMLLDGVAHLMAGDTLGTDELANAALYTHSAKLPDLLLGNVKGQALSTRRAIAATLSAYVLAFHGKPGSQRAVRGLMAMIAHHDDQIRFHAAKALWEWDRGLATQTLETLSSTNGEMQTEAQRLLRAWLPE